MTQVRRPKSDAGFALILALLALMLLTFLGLTLTTSTSTELRIATNYRWQQQALYNAEAGIEAGKSVLRGISNWGTVLPAVRANTVLWDGNTAPTGALGATSATSRNYEGWQCDKKGNGVGYGVVLATTTPAVTYQYQSTMFSQQLDGAVTLWVRHPTLIRPDGKIIDYGLNGDPVGGAGGSGGNDDTLILVSEGVAPYRGALMSNSRLAGNAAVQVIEVMVSRNPVNAQNPCGTRTGQAGGGPEGAGFSACDPITGAGLATALGTSASSSGNFVETAVK
jgi:type IV pilus assembly PilX-like protein